MHKGLSQLHADKARTDNDNIGHIALFNLCFHRMHIPGEPKAVNTLGICIFQGQAHGRGASSQNQNIIGQLFRFSVLYIG